MSKTAIITGITGQDGAYLSKFLLEKGYKVVGLLRSKMYSNLERVEYLGIADKIKFEECDLLDVAHLIRILQSYHPNEIYNLAAQSSIALSFNQPSTTLHFNTISVLNFLEAIKIIDNRIRFFQACSSAIYGSPPKLPVTISTELHPKDIYAISKTSAYWITINYRKLHGLFACNGILFNHESYLRSSGFIIKKVISEAMKIKHKKNKKKKIFMGDLEIHRDLGYAPKYVEAMWLMLQNSAPKDYLICSGKTVYLKEVVKHILEKTGLPLSCLGSDPTLYRPSDIKKMYGSNKEIKKDLGWKYDLSFYDVVDMMIQEEEKNINSAYKF